MRVLSFVRRRHGQRASMLGGMMGHCCSSTRYPGDVAYRHAMHELLGRLNGYRSGLHVQMLLLGVSGCAFR